MASTTFDFSPDLEITNIYTQGKSITVHTGDTLTFLKTIPDNVIQLIISSPPYNVGKVYEQKQNIDDYLAEQEPVLQELYRILAPSGSICWQTGNYVSSGEVFPLDMYYYPLFK